MGRIKEYARSIYGEEPKTMDELGHAIVKILNAYSVTGDYGRGAKVYTPKTVGLVWNLTHIDDVRTTHNGPEGTKYGFYDKSKEKYSGWVGRVWVRYNKDYPGFGSDPFRRSLTYPGTGGYGSYSGVWQDIFSSYHLLRGSSVQQFGTFPRPNIFSWDYQFFDADWPEIEENVARQKEIERWEIFERPKYNEKAMLAKLEDRYLAPPPSIPQPTHNFLWEDPETKAQDEAFLKECRYIIHNK